jgi:enoyl-CoA hydratase
MSDGPVHFELRDDVAVVRLDDGKANAISQLVIDGLQQAFDRAEKEAGAVLWVGRPGRFSAGFDLGVMRSQPDAARSLVAAGAELFLRLFTHPLPTVAACTGHAIAAGAIGLLSADTRIGAEGEFKIGLNEVGIGMTLPVFGVELARHRLSKRHFTRAVIQAELYDPSAAVDAGYLDRVVPGEALFEEALREAARLAQLPRQAHAGTKLRCREAIVAAIRDGGDLGGF